MGLGHLELESASAESDSSEFSSHDNLKSLQAHKLAGTLQHYRNWAGTPVHATHDSSADIRKKQTLVDSRFCLTFGLGSRVTACLLAVPFEVVSLLFGQLSRFLSRKRLPKICGTLAGQIQARYQMFNPDAARPARRIYVGGLPPSTQDVRVLLLVACSLLSKGSCFPSHMTF